MNSEVMEGGTKTGKCPCCETPTVNNQLCGGCCCDTVHAKAIEWLKEREAERLSRTEPKDANAAIKAANTLPLLNPTGCPCDCHVHLQPKFAKPIGISCKECSGNHWCPLCERNIDTQGHEEECPESLHPLAESDLPPFTKQANWTCPQCGWRKVQSVACPQCHIWCVSPVSTEINYQLTEEEAQQAIGAIPLQTLPQK